MRNGFIDLIRAHIEAKKQLSVMRKSAYVRRWLSDYIARDIMPKGKILYNMSRTIADLVANRFIKEMTKFTTGIDYDKVMENANKEFESKVVDKNMNK